MDNHVPTKLSVHEKLSELLEDAQRRERLKFERLQHNLRLSRDEKYATERELLKQQKAELKAERKRVAEEKRKALAEQRAVLAAEKRAKRVAAREVRKATAKINAEHEKLEKVRTFLDSGVEPALAGTLDSRGKIGDIPRRVESLFYLIADTRKDDVPLTRAELDVHPSTKDLSEREKLQLETHWPKFRDNLKKAREIQELRAKEVELATKATQEANALAHRHGLHAMPIADQLEATARIFNTQTLKASLTVAATDTEDIHSDPLSRELFKLRVGYVRDFIWISRNLVDLAERIRQTDNASVGDGLLSSEAKSLLDQANQMLLAKGVKPEMDFTK